MITLRQLIANYFGEFRLVMEYNYTRETLIPTNKLKVIEKYGDCDVINIAPKYEYKDYMNTLTISTYLEIEIYVKEEK